MSAKIAIIGAGLSGLTAAFKLKEFGKEVCVFEKSKGLSGRAASRTRNGCRYDYGANYFTVESNEVAHLLFQTLPTDGLCRIVGGIHPFDLTGKISAGEPQRNSAARWAYREGISTIGKRMVETAGIRVMTETRISRLKRTRGKWQLEAEGGAAFDDFDAVLITTPGPQTVDLLEASDLDRTVCDPIVMELKRSEYLCQFTVILNFPGSIPLPGDGYALINSDRRHDIAWISHENRKPGHVPEGESLFIVQMSPAWSHHHFNCAIDEVIAVALTRTTDLLGINLPAPTWSDVQRWRYAHPASAADQSSLKPASGLRLFFAGDTFVGKGRVPAVIESGMTAASQIIADFREQPFASPH
jgi:renalase